MKIKNLFLSLLLWVTIQICIGQTKDGMAKQDFLPASPDAAALGKFGDVPVNLSSGLPNISVPFYELKEGNIVLPVGLNYNASGIKSTGRSHPGLG
ncbi:MAG: hypothetical protein IPP72_13715 [Chitinophagaceae bacterium]|nr:hypothetical protein [Chitinophagaceae bacterium]